MNHSLRCYAWFPQTRLVILEQPTGFLSLAPWHHADALKVCPTPDACLLVSGPKTWVAFHAIPRQFSTITVRVLARSFYTAGGCF